MTSRTCVLLCAMLMALVPAAAAAQFQLLAPPDGAEISAAPIFEWQPGAYGAFLFYSVFAYDIGGWQLYYPASFWVAAPNLDMPTSWWDALAAGDATSPSYWAVVAVDVSSGTFAIAGPWSFVKQGVDLSGTWTEEESYPPSGIWPAVWEITQTGTHLDLIATRPQADTVDGTGSVDGMTITLTHPCYGNCGDCFYAFTGTIDPGEQSLAGEVSYNCPGAPPISGTWNAWRQDPASRCHVIEPGTGLPANPGAR